MNPERSRRIAFRVLTHGVQEYGVMMARAG